MKRTHPSLLLPLLAIAACQTDKMPLTGFFTPPPGTIVVDQSGGLVSGDSAINILPVFALEAPRTFQVLFNGQKAIASNGGGVYDYLNWQLQGWTATYANRAVGVPADTYAVEMMDDTGQNWGQSDPLTIQPNNTGQGRQIPTVILANFGTQVGHWNIDPTTQDADPATTEITVTNLVGADVVVERCVITQAGRPCTTVGTVPPGADLVTVETIASDSTTGDRQALIIHLASDVNQSYERDLIQPASSVGYCEVERILVHGPRALYNFTANVTAFALSSCSGYSAIGR
jgi:hypothetical protein